MSVSQRSESNAFPLHEFDGQLLTLLRIPPPQECVQSLQSPHSSQPAIQVNANHFCADSVILSAYKQNYCKIFEMAFDVLFHTLDRGAQSF